MPSPTKLTQPPGKTMPYVLESGTGNAFLLVGQVGRVLAGTRETGGKLAVLTLVGPARTQHLSARAAAKTRYSRIGR